MSSHPTLERNQAVLAACEPAMVWRHFGELAARPRPSGQEEEVRTYIIGWAEDHGLKCYRDTIGNLIVKVPGRGRGEEAPTVIMQGHLDMVTEKNSDSTHCFDTEPIALRREGERLLATGTTLGADNGIGVAPEIMGIGPVPAVRKLEAATGIAVGDYDAIELNEAFAAQLLACQRDLGFDMERCNVHGGAIALGHPIGCTGARIVVTLLNVLRAQGGKRGLATLCVSGGMGTALSVELL